MPGQFRYGRIALLLGDEPVTTWSDQNESAIAPLRPVVGVGREVADVSLLEHAEAEVHTASSSKAQLLEVVPMPDRGVLTIAFAEALEADIVANLRTTLSGANYLTEYVTASGVREHEFPGLSRGVYDLHSPSPLTRPACMTAQHHGMSGRSRSPRYVGCTSGGVSTSASSSPIVPTSLSSAARSNPKTSAAVWPSIWRASLAGTCSVPNVALT